MQEVSRRVFFKRPERRRGRRGRLRVSPRVRRSSRREARAATPKEASFRPKDDTPVGEHLVARVKNARTGEINLFIGQKEVTIHDRQIAARLIRATR
jgi:hypothetical protein